MDSCFAHLGYKYKSSDAYNIPYIKKPLKNCVVHCFIVAGTNIIAADIDLDPS